MTTDPGAITSYKGFDQNWQCRGFQFEVGKTYEHDGPVKACSSGFHACEYPLHVLRYYPPSTSRFAIVEQSGELSRHDEDSKVASTKLTFKSAVNLAGVIKAAVEYTLSRCTPAKGATSKKPNTVVSAEGERECATASGRNGKARGKAGCALFLVYRDSDWKIVHARAAIAGRDGIKPDTWYRLNNSGDFEEVS